MYKTKDGLNCKLAIGKEEMVIMELDTDKIKLTKVGREEVEERMEARGVEIDVLTGEQLVEELMDRVDGGKVLRKAALGHPDATCVLEGEAVDEEETVVVVKLICDQREERMAAVLLEKTLQENQCLGCKLSTNEVHCLSIHHSECQWQIR